MLHAINQKKVRLGSFRQSGEHLRVEDVVTSNIFGPLSFMTEDHRRAACESLVTLLGIPQPQWSSSPRFSFWEKLRATERMHRKRYSEPDLIIEDDVGTSIVCEVKWDAGLDEHELADQWLGMSSPRRSKSIHVLIAREPQKYLTDIEADRRFLKSRGIHRWPIFAVAWREIGHAAAQLASDRSTSPGIAEWCLQVSAFLNREDRLPFLGWGSRQISSVGTLHWKFSIAGFEGLCPVNRIDREVGFG